MKVYMRFLDSKKKSRWLEDIRTMRISVGEKLWSDEFGDYESLKISAMDEEGVFHDLSDICDVEVY